MNTRSSWRLLTHVRFLLAGVLFFITAAAAPIDQTPQATIEKLHGLLLETMQRAVELGVEGRYALLDAPLRQIYDFPRMTTVATGSYWTGADAAQREAMVEAFSRFSIATYASRFTGYSGETFEISGQRPGPRGTIFVDTRLVRSEAPPVPITYVMAQSNERWQIVDVLLEQSISELAVRRSEYSGILRGGGVDSLIATLNQKSEQLRKS